MTWVKLKMLNRLGIHDRRRLARRVLQKLPRAMSDAALYGVIIWGVGCIIPTPIDRAPAETNFPPSIDTTNVTPPFGPLTLGSNDTMSVAVSATDPNLDDLLQVKLMEFVAGSYGIIAGPAQMQPQNDNPLVRNTSTGTFDLKFCLTRTTGVHYVYAFVADRDFTSANSTTANGGLTDSNHWEITCQ
jgi:hypothetical protein